MRFFAFFVFFIIGQNLLGNDYISESTGLLFGVYSNYISPVKSSASECQFTPSCSQFSKQAINEYGFAIGTVLTADRLMRCSGGHAANSDYPKKNSKFIDTPKQNFLFGEGGRWEAPRFYAAQPTNSIDTIDKSLAFPFHLFEEQKFQLSVLELERLNFTSNRNIFEKTNLLIGLNEYMQNHSNEAFDKLSIINNIKQDELLNDYFLLNYIVADKGNLNILNINNCEKFKNRIDESLRLKLMIYSNFKMRDNNGIDTCLAALSSISQPQFIDSVRKFINLNIDKSSKSAWIAGLMSTVLPGSGYIYTGHFKDGLSAFIFNGLLGAGIYSLFKNDNTGSGILTSMVAVPFYLGNIIGSANSAEAENNRLYAEQQYKLRIALQIDSIFSAERLRKFWFN